MIIVHSDWSKVESELDRLSVMPSPKTTALLRGVMTQGFAMTQDQVHIDTGSLKSSGKEDEDISYTKHQWMGTIRYGGPSLGVNNPVDYAIYEKRRGGAHDFFLNLPMLHPQFIAAIKEALRG